MCINITSNLEIEKQLIDKNFHLFKIKISSWFIFQILFNLSMSEKLVMSDKFTLSDNMTYHFLWYIITLTSSPSDFNIRNTQLSQISGTGSTATGVIFSCLLLSSPSSPLLCSAWYLENILPSQIPFSWSVSSYLEFQLEFPPPIEI